MSETRAPSDSTSMEPWEVVDFPYFVGVRHRGSSRWSTILLKPTGQEIDVASLGADVVLHSNGIEFVPVAPDARIIAFPPPSTEK